MRRIQIPIAAVVAFALAGSEPAWADQPANPGASCVALITSWEASQLAPGSVGEEVAGLAASPRLGTRLVSPLAHEHLGSIDACRQAEA
jgi:hypothetical protein